MVAGPGMRQQCAAVLHMGPTAVNGVQLHNIGAVAPCRFCGNAISFDGLSALTQLTRLATEYKGGAQRETLYSQLAQLTGLQHLSAPRALQSDGGELVPPIVHHQTLPFGALCNPAITSWHMHLRVLLACMATQGLLPAAKQRRPSADVSCCHQVSRAM